MATGDKLLSWRRDVERLSDLERVRLVFEVLPDGEIMLLHLRRLAAGAAARRLRRDAQGCDWGGRQIATLFVSSALTGSELPRPNLMVPIEPH